MKQRNNYSLALVILGALLLSAGFVLDHYLVLSDGKKGFALGISIGIMLIGVMGLFKQNKPQSLR